MSGKNSYCKQLSVISRWIKIRKGQKESSFFCLALQTYPQMKMKGTSFPETHTEIPHWSYYPCKNVFNVLNLWVTLARVYLLCGEIKTNFTAIKRKKSLNPSTPHLVPPITEIGVRTAELSGSLTKWIIRDNRRCLEEINKMFYFRTVWVSLQNMRHI